MEGVVLEKNQIQCPYLEDQIFISEQILLKEINSSYLETLLNLGFRHFGNYFFRPVCSTCHQCLPIRIPTKSFSLSKSHRRLMKMFSHLTILPIQAPVSNEKYDLYLKHKKKFKDFGTESLSGFEKSFFSPYKENYQLEIRQDNYLVALLHMDITSHILSAVYCYYDPTFSPKGLGTFSILSAIDFAISKKIAYVYLGYYVPKGRHMDYKVKFRPNEILTSENSWHPYIQKDLSSPLLSPPVYFKPLVQLVKS